MTVLAWLVAGILLHTVSIKETDQYKSSFLPEIGELQENHICVIEYQFSDDFSLKYALAIGRRTL